MATTPNLGLVLLDVAQLQKEVSVNAIATIIDDGCFVRFGSLASRPAAGRAGRLYFVTDAGVRRMARDNGASWDELTGLYLAGGNPPTAAAGAAAGTLPPAPVVTAGSNGFRGNLTCGTGTAPPAGGGALVAVTFVATFGLTPYVIIVPRNQATALLSPYVFATATTGFTIGVGATAGVSQANTTYAFDFLTIT